MEIAGASILVTGASGGLGRAIVRDLAGRGAHLVVSARNVAILDKLAADTGAEVVVADLGDSGDVDRLAARAATCDVLVANAGVGNEPPLLAMTQADIDQALEVNLRSPIVLSHAYARARISAGLPGQIVLIGSLAGLAASPGTRLYNATKFGLRGFALSLRQDLAETGVGCSHVLPGLIRDAGMFADNGLDLPAAVRTKAPADVAAAVARAIVHDRAEVYVAPTELRMATSLAGLAPALSAALQRRLGIADRR